MENKATRNTHFRPVAVKTGLVVILGASWFGIYFSVAWIYEQIRTNLGFGLAQVTVAFLVILILFLILVGFGAGFGMDRAVRRRKLQSLRIYPLTKRCWIFKSLWGDLTPEEETAKDAPADEPPAPDLQELLSRPRRRGRPPMHSIDRWRQVVMAWENRDPLHNPMTLAEFLSEQFGTHADGSPRMSENSFYDWRKRVMDDLQNQEEANNR